MGNKIKISIIVPAFNVEKYIDRCLESLTVQDISMNEYEIIIVNDGSTDSTLEILNGWKAKFENIKIYSQENKGQSAARNFALKQAFGEYIFYVDADDKVEQNTLNELVEKSEKYDTDILRFNFFNLKKNSFLGEFNKTYSGTEFLCYCDGIWSPCMQLFRREFLIRNDFYFLEGITSEDAELLPCVYLHAQCCMAIDRNIYYYIYNPTSTTKEKKANLIKIERRIMSQLVVLESNFRLYEKYISNPRLKNTLYRTVLFPAFTDFCTMLFSSPFAYKTAKSIQKKYHSKEIFPFKIQLKCTLKHRIMFYIMNSNFLFTIFYFSGMKNIYQRKFQ